MNPRSSPLIVLSLTLAILSGFACAAEPTHEVGVAKIDITPSTPIRLSGYGNRRDESEGIGQRLWAKALAIGGDADLPAVLVTVDNCGVPAAMRDEVIARLVKRTKLAPERFALCFSHTHCAPCLSGALPNIFSSDIPPEHQERIDRYSRELTDKLERVALAALADRKPASLAWAQGSVTFARNRRAQWGGPVDWALPALFVTTPDGKLRAVFTNYACHATTLQYNFVSGDWPGYAMEAIERDHPGAIALVALGCGADANPHPRSKLELAVQHGEVVGAEVTRLLERATPIRGALACRTKPIELPFAPLPSREEWLTLAQSKSANIAYHARRNLMRLDRGEALPESVPYLVQTWNFGTDLAMVFLPGEVVVDYSLRLKIECDARRMWVNGYSNDATCYIPSRRVLEEGGYEGALAMLYYDRPTRFAPGIEDRIIGAVHELLPKDFDAHFRTDTAPKAPADSLAAIKTTESLAVELVAAEPMIADPVAIDWDARGRMWVVEQPDYPMGMDGKWKPGGRVRILTDTDADGRYDKAELFLDGIPFPTGITCWRNGALIGAAPDILFAADTDGDGRADEVKKLFSGFFTDNYNARVNSLALGLDNWIHGANGLLGGTIASAQTGREVNISGRDFRMNPDSGAFETASGVTQQGRARDDWGNWFGCSNSRFAFHFPLPEHYLRRNPHVPPPEPRVNVPAEENAGQLNPISAPLERFNHPEAYGQITSACGLGIYRDVLLGEQFNGNAFIGEVAHNLVRRYQLTAKGATFEGHRPADEQSTEFLASADNWTRPVQVRTGPDGALYIVDMYRAVIEHTRWIPADKLAKLDPRAGETMGRIYRIVPRSTKMRAVRDLTKLTTPELSEALDVPNGTTRDLVHAELLHRADRAAVEPLAVLARTSKLPTVRVQALCVLDGLRALSPELIAEALSDSDPHVRAHAIRLSEPNLAPCLALANDPDFSVRYQLALSLGEWKDPRAAEALATVAKRALGDPWMRAAVLSSSTRWPLEVIDALGDEPGRGDLVGGLIATAAATASDMSRLIGALTPKGEIERWQIAGLLHFQDALDRRRLDLASLRGAEALRPLYAAAHHFAERGDPAAIRLLGRGFNDPRKDLPELARLIAPGSDATVQKAALDTLTRTRERQVPALLLAAWEMHGPVMRTSILNALLSRDEWTNALLDALDKGVVASSDLPAATRERLASHANAKIQQRAAKLLPAKRTDRAAVIAKYQPVANLRGDAAKGAAVFKNICATCHSYLGIGNEVGPSVATYRTKAVQDFLVAILDPNAVVEPRYSTFTVQMKDGRALAGVISSETATTLVLSQPGGTRETILRSDVAALHPSPLSLMPEGLDQAVAPQDMADLIAFLKSGG